MQLVTDAILSSSLYNSGGISQHPGTSNTDNAALPGCTALAQMGKVGKKQTAQDEPKRVTEAAERKQMANTFPNTPGSLTSAVFMLSCSGSQLSL